jgi:hypothetical protein
MHGGYNVKIENYVIFLKFGVLNHEAFKTSTPSEVGMFNEAECSGSQPGNVV